MTKEEIIEQINRGYGEFRFLDLAALMDAKRAAGRDRDKQPLVRLNAIRERIGKRS